LAVTSKAARFWEAGKDACGWDVGEKVGDCFVDP
jgi:hypothetical protein